MWNPCCDCDVCPCQGCDFEECDCESCEDTCRNYKRPQVKKKRTDIGDPSNLYAAIMNGNKREVCTIVKEENVNLRKIYTDGNQALHLVFFNFEETDIIQILKAFLAKKVNLYFENKDQETVLHIAVEKRMKNAIDFLLKKGFKLEMIYNPSNPMPHFVIDSEYAKFLELSKRGGNHLASSDRENIEMESINFVEWLISKGFDFDQQNYSHQSALHYAIKKNLQHLLPTLLKHSNDISYISNDYNRTLLHLFVSTNDSCKDATMQYLAKHGVWSVDYAQRYTAEIIKIMLDKGVSVDAVDKYGYTALHMCIRTNIQMGIFEMLLNRFPNVHQKIQSQMSLLYDVAKTASRAESESEAECFVRIMQSLIDRGADVNFKDKYGATPVYEVVSTKNLQAVALMKKNNADFKITPFGYTLLHFLAMKKPFDKSTNESNEGIFDLLIDEFPDINVLDEDGHTPLHVAVKYRHIAIIRKLITHGADVNFRQNKRQMTPLHYAAEYKDKQDPAALKEIVEIAELLIDNGANINSKGMRDRRPLDGAAGASNSQMLQMLLNRGAFVHARDNDGKTALFHALSRYNPDNAEKLLNYGAEINETSIVRLVESKYEENYSEVVDPILQHWIKLEAANLPCLKEYRAFIKDLEYQKFYQGCLEEIKLLKSVFIGDQTTFYTFLQIHPNRRCAYAYCEMLQKHVESPLFEKKFPKYSALILGNYHTAMARKLLVDKAKQIWQELTEITLPDVCIERIFAFLNNADLVDMIE